MYTHQGKDHFFKIYSNALSQAVYRYVARQECFRVACRRGPKYTVKMDNLAYFFIIFVFSYEPCITCGTF